MGIQCEPIECPKVHTPNCTEDGQELVNKTEGCCPTLTCGQLESSNLICFIPVNSACKKKSFFIPAGKKTEACSRKNQNKAFIKIKMYFASPQVDMVTCNHILILAKWNFYLPSLLVRHNTNLVTF